MPLEQARAHLMKIVGVGPKVADCALLYGFHRLECCPMDVWMKRVFAALYPNGLPDCAQDFIGIAQQYLFHYVRCCPQIFGSSRKGGCSGMKSLLSPLALLAALVMT